MTDIVKKLQFEKEQLQARLALLEETHLQECGQIGRYSDELRKATFYLAEAVKIIHEIGCRDCTVCKNNGKPREECERFAFVWEYEEAARELIGGYNG